MSREIIQGAQSKFTIDCVDSTGKRFDLTGNTEIKCCFKASTTVVEKLKTTGGVTVVGDPADGQIESTLEVADTDAMPPVMDGCIEVVVDYGSGTVKKSQILDAFIIIEKKCS